VGSRNLIINNQAYQDTSDPNAAFMIVPPLDFINHSSDPNVIVMPYHDKVSDHSYVVVQALKEISEGEQLTMSYGNLPNTHLIQKYGFVQHNNPLVQSVLQIPYHDYCALLYEES